MVGKVVKTGTGCRKFKAGDRVGIAWLRHTCGVCGFCKSGRENLCDQSQYTGYHADGGYAEFAAAPEDFAYAISDRFSDEEAAPLLCAGIVGYRAFKKSNLPAGGKLGIFGFGSSAHVIIQIALHRKAEVFVVTRDKKHQQLAESMGAKWAGDDATRIPSKLDSVIIFAPAGELAPPALRSLNKGGTVALAGIHMSPIPSMTYADHLFHEKQLVSVEANTREDGLEFLNEAAEIGLHPHIAPFSFDEANEALIRLKQDKIQGAGVLKVAPPLR